MIKPFIVTFIDGQVSIMEAESSKEIFETNHNVRDAIRLDLIKDLIAEYEQENLPWMVAETLKTGS